MRKQLSFLALFLYTLLSLAGSKAVYAHADTRHVQQNSYLSQSHLLVHGEPELGAIVQGHLFHTAQPAKKLSGSAAADLSSTGIDTRVMALEGRYLEPGVFCKAYLNHIYPTHNFW